LLHGVRGLRLARDPPKMGKKRLFLIEICLIQVIKAYLEKMIFMYDTLTIYSIDLQITHLLPDTLLIQSKLLTSTFQIKTDIDFLKNVEIRGNEGFFQIWALPSLSKVGFLCISLPLIRTFLKKKWNILVEKGFLHAGAHVFKKYIFDGHPSNKGVAAILCLSKNPKIT
jgi:hypothetical protein